MVVKHSTDKTERHTLAINGKDYFSNRTAQGIIGAWFGKESRSSARRLFTGPEPVENVGYDETDVTAGPSNLN